MPFDVEVMIVSYASAGDVATCLESIARVAPDMPVAVREHHPDVVSFSEVALVAAASDVRVRTEHDPDNPGFGAGCNALARTSAAAWYLFLNPDARLIAWPWRDEPPPSPAVIGATFTDDAGDHCGRRYRIRDEIARSWLRRPGPPPDGSGFVSGAALLVDAATFHRLGGFDEGYFLFYEDIDLCLRANALGVPTSVEPDWLVEHTRAHSTRDRFAAALIWSYESGCRFHTAHGGPVRGYRLYVTVDALARAGVHAARGDPVERAAYLTLARRAISDCVRRGRSRP